MVDVVLYLEGERYFAYRVLRGVKNRFGSTNEIGMFEMQGEGMEEIANPSDILISERSENPAGSIIVGTMEGTRPLLVELQALTTPTVFGFPRRTANGIDYNRLTLLMAVIEKRAKMTLSNQDAYLNVVGGIRINEPGIDLGIILSVCSSYKNKSVPDDIIVVGEVGLTGEVRRVSMIDKLLKEAEKLGFKKCIIPENNKKLLKEKFKLDIIGVKNIKDAMKEVRSIIEIIIDKTYKRGGKMIKRESGITLIVLVITILLMIILASVGISAGTVSTAGIKLQNFSYELQQIQGRVDSIYEKMKLENDPSFMTLYGETLGKNIRTSDEAVNTLYNVKKIQYAGASTSNKDLYPNGQDSIYRYFSKTDLSNALDIKNPKLDVIINFKTKEVISVKGYVYKEDTYYRLSDM